MDEEELKRKKYRALNRRLKQIKQELSTARDIENQINNIAESTLKIDKKVVEDETFKNLKNNHQKVLNSISSTIASVASKS